MGDKALRDMLLSMTTEEVREYWEARQEAARDAGQPHYTSLVDAITGETFVTIEK